VESSFDTTTVRVGQEPLRSKRPLCLQEFPWSELHLCTVRCGILERPPRCWEWRHDRTTRLRYLHFTIKRGLKDFLLAAQAHFAELEPASVRVEFPDPKTKSQGEIWRDIVRPKLDEASHVVAYVDKPNANVGFKIGYALGRGNRNSQVQPAKVALALHAMDVPDWLEKPPFRGFNVTQFEDEQALIETIANERGFSVTDPVESGKDLLFLCPESGTMYLTRAQKPGPPHRHRLYSDSRTHYPWVVRMSEAARLAGYAELEARLER